jgi:hypothetical protein
MPVAVVPAAALVGPLPALPPKVIGELTLQSSLDHELRQLRQQAAFTGEIHQP